MSGMEVVGIVLGVLPILFQALDAYKRGSGRIKSGLHRRETVKKLARALRLQMQILDALTRDILLRTGCAIPSDDAQLYVFLKHGSLRDEVNDFLGAQNARVLSEALQDCLSIVKNATARIAELVPSIKDNAEIQEVLNANDTTRRNQINFVARFTLVMSLNDLEREIEALDRSTNTLERFANRIITNAYSTQTAPSRQAMKLAKSLRIIRQRVDNLHTAVGNQWPKSCHPIHEVKLFLDDRNTVKHQQQVPRSVPCLFSVVLSGHVHEQAVLWHHTVIEVANEDTHGIVTPQQTRVQISVSTADPVATQYMDITDLCSVIEDAIQKKSQATFRLCDRSKLAVSLDTTASDRHLKCTNSITLEFILKNAAVAPRPLPMKGRMILAHKLVSSFLQLLRTPWIEAYWSASKVLFLIDSNNNCQADLRQPYVSHKFSGQSAPTIKRQEHVKDDLVNLGILLLEIWHAETIETHFLVMQTQAQPQIANASTSTSTPNNQATHLRHACALQWLNEVENPLLDLYNKAVSYCIAGTWATNQTHSSQWDDMELWKDICENVVVPLSKLS